MTAIVPKSPYLIAGVIFVLAMTLVGIFAPLVAPYHPKETHGRQHIGISPFETSEYPLGTDYAARDVLSRLIFSFRIPVIWGGEAVLLGTVSSLVLVWLGARSSVFKNTGQLPPRGFLNYSLLRLAGLILLIGPPFGLFVVAILGSGLLNVALVVIPFAAIVPLSLIYWSARSKSALQISQEPMTGTGNNAPGLPVRIACRECLVLLPITYSLAFLMGMFLETPLTFLGVGIPPDVQSLGNMLQKGSDHLRSMWWISLTPLAVLAIGAGAFMAIVLPIRRVQKRSHLSVQHNATFCTQCGSQVGAASNFCIECGTELAR